MNNITAAYIRAHREEDVRQLALQGRRDPAVDLPFALDQIAGWQKARRKLPSWAAVDGLCYPPHISMEQCSSEATGVYKRSVLQRLTQSWHDGTLYDLTGGFGVDFSFLAPLFPKAVYVEHQSRLCEIARHNFPLLGLSHAEVRCAEGEEVLEALPEATPEASVALFLDPARRDSHGGKTVLLEDCTPDVTRLRDRLLQKATLVMLKLSPMLDWHQAAEQLSSVGQYAAVRNAQQEVSTAVIGGVSEVHIVSVGNECKELLLVLTRGFCGAPAVYCVNDGVSFSYRPGEESPQESISDETTGVPDISRFESSEGFDGALYLYEPHASIRKAGCFAEVATRYGVRALGANSHLFVSHEWVRDFPGRQFEVQAVSTMNKRQLKEALRGMTQANITARNFPMTVDQLRKKLRLKEGGDHYLFATTIGHHDHRLLFCKKLN